MSWNTNVSVLTGRLGADPEMREAGQKVVCNFSIAVNGPNDTTMWVPVVAWQRTAEICMACLQKGSLVLVSGRNNINKWTSKDGTPREKWEVVAYSVEPLNNLKPKDPKDPDPHNEWGQERHTNYNQAPISDDDVPF